MNNKEEAELKWAKIAPLNSIAPMSYLNGISDFKAALIQAFKNEVDQTLSEMEEFRKDSNDIDYNVCQTKVNTLNLMITKINETKPL